MADQIRFGRDAARDIISVVRWFKSHNNSPPTIFDGDIETGAPQFRIVKTTTNDDFPTYPSSGDTFVVELGELSWTASTGSQSNVWTPYDPQDTRLVHDITGTYWEEGSYVEIALHHGRWFIIGGTSSASSIAILTPGAGIAARAADQVFSAQCRQLTLNASLVLCQAGLVDVVNLSNVPVAGYTIGKADRILIDGSPGWCVDVESCNGGLDENTISPC